MGDRDDLAMRTPKFDAGQVLMSPGAIVVLDFNGISPIELLHRHLTGDWGDLTEEDKAANEAALTNGSRILSAYELAGGERLWIITEADRSATTLLLPEEY
jgi:hypothetical protein